MDCTSPRYVLGSRSSSSFPSALSVRLSALGVSLRLGEFSGSFKKHEFEGCMDGWMGWDGALVYLAPRSGCAD